MSAEENKAVIRSFIEQALNNNELVAPDFVELDPMPGQAQGVEGLKHVLEMLFTAFPDLHWSIEEQVAEGDKVVSRYIWRGTHQGDFLDIPATGKRVEVPVIVIDRVVNGKLTDSRMIMDQLTMMQQLGVTPASG